MKYLKIFACAIVAAGFCACSSNDDEMKTNTTGDAVVTMGQSEFQSKENRKIVKVPISVKGERDGLVTVTCEVDIYGENPAVEDGHYYLTSRVINIMPEDSIGYLEFKMIDDPDVNEDRTFMISIESVEGGKIGDPSTCIFTIKDDDNDPYDRICGEWKVDCIDVYNEAPVSLKVSITQPDEYLEDGSENWQYGKVVFLEGLVRGVTNEPVQIMTKFFFDESSETGSLSIEYGQKLGEVDLEAYGYTTTGESYLAYVLGKNIISSGSITLNWNEEFTQIDVTKLPSNQNLEDGAFFGYYVPINYEGREVSMTLDEISAVKTFTRNR